MAEVLQIRFLVPIQIDISENGVESSVTAHLDYRNQRVELPADCPITAEAVLDFLKTDAHLPPAVHEAKPEVYKSAGIAYDRYKEMNGTDYE